METGNKSFYFEEFVLNPERRLLRQYDREVPLRRKTFDVLCRLVAQRHRVVSKEELLDAVWPGLRIEPQGVFQSISELRSVFGRRDFIRTVRGVGYQWVAPTATRPGTSLRAVRPRHRHWGLAASIAVLLAASIIATLPGDSAVSTLTPARFATSDALLDLAREHLGRGELDLAENYLDIILDQNPHHLEARLDLAYIHQERGMTDSARRLAETVHSDSIATGTAYVRMASAALISQMPKSSIDRSQFYAQEAISIGTRLQLPTFAAAGFERLGELYLDQGQPVLAAIEWNKAIANYHDACPASEARVRKLLASIAWAEG